MKVDRAHRVKYDHKNQKVQQPNTVSPRLTSMKNGPSIYYQSLWIQVVPYQELQHESTCAMMWNPSLEARPDHIIRKYGENREEQICMVEYPTSNRPAKPKKEVTSETSEATYIAYKEPLNKRWTELKKALAVASKIFATVVQASDNDPRIFTAKQRLHTSHSQLKDACGKLETMLEWHKMPEGGGLTEAGIKKFLPQTQTAMDDCYSDLTVMKAAIKASEDRALTHL